MPEALSAVDALKEKREQGKKENPSEGVAAGFAKESGTLCFRECRMTLGPPRSPGAKLRHVLITATPYHQRRRTPSKRTTGRWMFA